MEYFDPTAYKLTGKTNFHRHETMSEWLLCTQGLVNFLLGRKNVLIHGIGSMLFSIKMKFKKY